MGCCQRRTSCSKAASSPRCQRLISSASCGGTIVPPTTGRSKNAGGGQTDDAPSEFVRVAQAVTGISTRRSRFLGQPLPPTPSPKRRGGAEQEVRELALPPGSGSSVSFSPSPLRGGG